ncbi:AAA family ATPase [Holophaga foetida]|uniref:AAA family ATPase n=1 Tax=Holophaga foetida TaxID=35839 RepID=UPI0002474D58|nr:AAA family ATPase [Holophaga foetida]
MADRRKLSSPRIEGLTVRNYRALANVTFTNLRPLTVLLGPNGSGKSTVFDVFAFLSEAFGSGLRKAWDRRGRFKELRSRGCEGPIEFEIRYREKHSDPIITYHLSVDESPRGPVVAAEWLQWRRGASGKPFRFLDFTEGKGEVISGDAPESQDKRIKEELDSPEALAVNALGQLAKHPRVAALRRFITGWSLSYLTADHTRTIPEAGPQEHLSQTGDNLANVIQYLREQHPDLLKEILGRLKQRVPRMDRVDADLMGDGRLLLLLKDAPFDRPILAKWASDGTLKMLAYLVALYDPAPPALLGLEEPENHLHPRLLYELAEECREASGGSQLIVTSHSPFFLNAMRPEEVWVLNRNAKGYTEAFRADELMGIPEHVSAGGKLGQLWMEGFFGVGDPTRPDLTPLKVRKG